MFSHLFIFSTNDFVCTSPGISCRFSFDSLTKPPPNKIKQKLMKQAKEPNLTEICCSWKDDDDDDDAWEEETVDCRNTLLGPPPLPNPEVFIIFV
jgi:hypothetical protein